MASFTADGFDFTGFDEMIDEISNIVGKATYDGVGIIADAINKEIDAIPSNLLLNERERDELHQALATSRHKKTTDGREAYIDFSGQDYNGLVLKGKINPSGQGEPVILIARSICKGTSFRGGKYNFVQKGFNSVKDKAEKTIADEIEDELGKLNK